MERVDGAGDIQHAFWLLPLSCTVDGEGKLTGVCFIVPDEPLGQKPDDQGWRQRSTSAQGYEYNLDKVCVKPGSCSLLTYISHLRLTCVAGIFPFPCHNVFVLTASTPEG